MFSVEATPVMFAGLLVMFGWCCVWSLVEVLRVRALIPWLVVLQA